MTAATVSTQQEPIPALQLQIPTNSGPVVTVTIPSYSGMSIQDNQKLLYERDQQQNMNPQQKHQSPASPHCFSLSAAFGFPTIPQGVCQPLLAVFVPVPQIASPRRGI